MGLQVKEDAVRSLCVTKKPESGRKIRKKDAILAGGTFTRETIVKKGLFGALAMLAFAAVPGLAEAAVRGYSTANVNMRSGPGTNYPAVTVIPVGATLTIHGCLREVPWCDVSFARGRGWVAGRYVQAVYRQNRVYVEPRYYQGLGVPTIDFDVGVYWDRYYRDRDFYRERDRWRERDRDRWRQPPRPPIDNGWRDRDRDRYPDRDWSGRPDPRWERDRDRDWDRRPDRRNDDGWNRPDRRPDDGWNRPDRRPDDRPDDRRPPRPPVQEDTGRPQRLPSDDTWTRRPDGSGSSSDQRQDNGGNRGMDLNGDPCTSGTHGCIPAR